MEPVQWRRQKIVLEAREIPKMRCSPIFLECLFDGTVEDWQSQINMHCLKRFRSDCSPTHFIRRLGCSQEKISCLDAGLEPGGAELAFFDHGGSRENPYYARLGDRGVNDALLNARLRVDPNQQIFPPITCGNQSAREILIKSLRRRAFRSRDHCLRWRSGYGRLFNILDLEGASRKILYQSVQ